MRVIFSILVSEYFCCSKSDLKTLDLTYTYYNPRTHDIQPLPNWPDHKKEKEEEEEKSEEKEISIVKTITQPRSKRAKMDSRVEEMLSQVRTQTRKRLGLKP